MLLRPRTPWWASLAAIAVVGWMAAPAAALPQVTMLKRISGPNPFPPSCTPSVEPLPPDSSGEPRLAVDPRDSQRMVAVFGQLPSFVTMATGDGGRSWTRALPPGLSKCTGGTSDFTGDGYIAFGSDGTAYLSSIPTLLPIPNTTAAPQTWVVLSRSSDGGRSWASPVTVAPDDGSFWDKDAVTADPARPGAVYETFIKSDQSNGSAGYLAVSHDHGASFSPPAQNFPDQQLQFMQDPEIVALPDGTLVEVFVLFNDSEELPASAQIPVTIEAMRSTDAGAHWSPPVAIAQAPNAVPYEPDSGQQIDALVWPSVAAGPDGTVYASWQANTSTHSGAIEISRSSDDGQSWTTPTPVAQISAQAWQPTVAVRRDGTVGLTWYDARNDKPGDGQFTTDVWFASSADHGTSWQQLRLAGPFDFLQAGQRNGRPFIGDYQGLVPTTDGFAAAFAMAPPASGHDHSAIFFARIQLHPPPTCSLPPTRRLRVRIIPSSVRAHHRQRFTVIVTTRNRRHPQPVTGATVALTAKRLRTNRRGRAVFAANLATRGIKRIRVTACGYQPATLILRVR